METKVTNTDQTAKPKTVVFKGARVEEYEKEIEVPAYFEHGAHKYKIINENDWVKVQDREILGEVSGIILFKCRPCYADNILMGGKPITEVEFNEAFQTALSKIQNLQP